MRRLFSNYPLTFFVGLVVVSVALGFGSVSGEILSASPNLAALRMLGAGLMVGGLVMWIALVRDEAGQPGLSALFALLVVAGVLALLAYAIFPSLAFGAALGWGGLGATAAGLVLGLLAALIAPASSGKPATHWPEGGEQEATQPGPAHH